MAELDDIEQFGGARGDVGLGGTLGLGFTSSPNATILATVMCRNSA